MKRVRGLAVVLMLMALGVFAATASAESLSMTFSEARANVGEQLFDDPLFDPPETASLEAQMDDDGEISGGNLEVPTFETFIEEPIEAWVTVNFDIGEVSGHFDEATGALTLSGVAGGTLTAVGEECTVTAESDTGDLTLTTAGNSGGTNPRSGVPFNGGLAGAGSIAGQWNTMEAVPTLPEYESFCNNVEGEIGGPGGVWLEQDDLVPPTPPQLLRTDPHSPNVHGTPRILGEAEPGSTVRIYAGAGCSGAPVAVGNAAQLDWPGIAVVVAEGVSASFSATATDAAGNASPCSAPISYLRLSPPPPPPPACVVPKHLVGKKLNRAKTMLRAAHCTVGKVTKPKRPKGAKQWKLVVKSANPAAGASPASGKVNLRLGPKSS